MALDCLEIGPGDEVLVPSNTFIATWLAVARVGAIPIPVEPDPYTYNITRSLLNVIPPKTKAIIPVHLFGQPCDLDPILDFAKQHNLYVIEDAAQAHGSTYKKRRIGSHSHLVCWVFILEKSRCFWRWWCNHFQSP